MFCCVEGDDVVVEDGKNVVKGRNRQVLGDIGNVVRENYPKNEPAKINHRPRTRSQNSTLLVEENLKVCSFSLSFDYKLGFFVRFDILMLYVYCFDLQKPVVKRIAVPKPKKVAAKSKVIEVIEISSGSDEERSLVVVKQKKAMKKKATTYTSVLTARSKVNLTFEMKIHGVK